MVKISIDLKKSVEQNAAVYFEKAKKAKKKLEGAKKTVEVYEKRLKEAMAKKEKAVEQNKKECEKKDVKKRWYEKFRWFISSEGFLCIGGRDATSNEIVIKKHTEKGDLVFHTDMAGSPFFVVKPEGKIIGEKTKQETAQATASYSRAWKLGLKTSDVFYVKPEQVTKEAKAGEFMPKGAFMIIGKTTYIHPEIKLAIGMTKDGRVMGGPVEAVKNNCERFVIVVQGEEKTSAAAKKIKAKIGGDLDEIIKALPAGGCEIER